MKLHELQEKRGLALCRSCKEVLPLARFRRWEKAGQNYIAKRCDLCERGGAQISQAPAGEAIPTGHRGEAFWRKRNRIAEAKRQPCADCGRSFPVVCMDFDHRPGVVKCFTISESIDRKAEDIEAEILKCDVVCACCHRIRTARRGHPGAGRPRKL